MLKDIMLKRFLVYKDLGEKAIQQLNDEQLHWKHNDEDNSVYVIVKHLHGNMLSRFTDFMSSDGEKSWRKRDDEFEEEAADKKAVLQLWNEGWNCVINALQPLRNNDMEETITIRGEKHTVADAILRQIAHYAYHVGQIAYIAKTIKRDHWQTLSIAKGRSADFNKEMLNKK